MEKIGDMVAELGECPVWSTAEQLLYWIDIEGKLVLRTDIATGQTESRPLSGRPGYFVLTSEPGQLVVGLEHQIVRFNWEDGSVDPILDLEDESPHKRLNDGRCDAQGRYWVGSMDLPPTELRGRGTLHRLDPTESGLAASQHRSDIGISNGMAFSPDGRIMYWADTPRKTVWAYDIDPDTGDRSGERVFLDFSSLRGLPDGACVDEDGCYWVACVYGSALLRATPEGKVDRYVELPVLTPTMPAFVGPNLDTLVVTSLRHEGADDLVGSLLATDIGIRGIPEPVLATL